nr:hypothetical protein SDXFZFDS_SDXFZFDS_CDS_0008 [Microvirus sp.]
MTRPEDFGIIKEIIQANVHCESVGRLLDKEAVQIEKARKLVRPIEREEK